MSRTIFITGASSGFGAALAPLYARDGGRVALAARRTDRLEALARQIRDAGGIALPVACDVRDPEAVRRAVAQCEAELGPVDLLIANAGVSARVTATHFDPARIEALFQVNFFGALYCIDAVLPGMLARRRGQIVGISSLAAYLGLPGSLGYGASKAALSNVLEGMRIELRPHGIPVTTISPGFVRTEMTQARADQMPFLMEVDEAARHIYDAIAREVAEYAFPWQMAAVVKAARLLPASLTDPIAATFHDRIGGAGDR